MWLSSTGIKNPELTGFGVVAPLLFEILTDALQSCQAKSRGFLVEGCGIGAPCGYGILEPPFGLVSGFGLSFGAGSAPGGSANDFLHARECCEFPPSFHAEVHVIQLACSSRMTIGRIRVARKRSPSAPNVMDVAVERCFPGQSRGVHG